MFVLILFTFLLSLVILFLIFIFFSWKAFFSLYSFFDLFFLRFGLSKRSLSCNFRFFRRCLQLVCSLFLLLFGNSWLGFWLLCLTFLFGWFQGLLRFLGRLLFLLLMSRCFWLFWLLFLSRLLLFRLLNSFRN